MAVGAGQPPAGPSPARDFAGLQSAAAEVGASLQAARTAASEPPAAGGGNDFSIDALRADVGALVESLEVPASVISEPGALPAAPAAQLLAPRDVSLVFHQTFQFQGMGPDVAEEVTRQMELVMRRASVEAGLAESDDAF